MEPDNLDIEVNVLAGRVKFYHGQLVRIQTYTEFINAARGRLEKASGEGLGKEDLTKLDELKVAYSTPDEVEFGVRAESDPKWKRKGSTRRYSDPIYQDYKPDSTLEDAIRYTHLALESREAAIHGWRVLDELHMDKWREARCYMESLDSDKKKKWEQIDEVYKQFERLQQEDERLPDTQSTTASDLSRISSDTVESASIGPSQSSGGVTDSTADSLSL